MKEICDVYVRKFPFSIESEKIFPPLRAKEIVSCKNEKVKKEKFYVWKLLEEGLLQTLGLDIKTLLFQKENGKWSCENCYFSLSHSGDLAAVAISTKPVGIDVEKLDTARFEKLKDDVMLTGKENYARQNAEIKNRLWTVKEAIFKRNGQGRYKPSSIETDNVKVKTEVFFVEEQGYILSVACDVTPRFIKEKEVRI